MNQLREKSIEFAREHLSECASELLERGETGVLPDGKVRELARMIGQWTHSGYSSSINVAESIINTEALKLASGKSDK